MVTITSKEVKEHKGYQVIVRDLDSGEEEINQVLKGVIIGQVDDKAACTHCFAVCSYNALIAMCESVIGVAKKTMADAKMQRKRKEW